MSSDNGDFVSKKPEDSDFQQQRLKAWQPLLTPKWVIGTFLIIGACFIPVGIVIVVYSNRVTEIEMRYDNWQAPNGTPYPDSCGATGNLFLKSNTSDPVQRCNGDALTCTIQNIGYDPMPEAAVDATVDACSVDIPMHITEDMAAPIYVYYKLSNYYQNHRRYVKSRSDTQLASSSGGGDTTSCDPLETDPNGKPYYPCGLIAGSFFIDRFSGYLERANGGYTSLGNWSMSTENWDKRGIAWASDREHKFKDNPTARVDAGHKFVHTGLLGVRLPRVDDEDFIVWMRTAGLPTFKKLYRVIRTDLKKGDVVHIKALNYYPVASFSGEKAIVLSTTSWLGGRNSFLGWAYIIVGIICVVLALAFFIKHKVSPRPLGDMKYFNWPGAQTAAAGPAPSAASRGGH